MECGGIHKECSMENNCKRHTEIKTGKRNYNSLWVIVTENVRNKRVIINKLSKTAINIKWISK